MTPQLVGRLRRQLGRRLKTPDFDGWATLITVDESGPVWDLEIPGLDLDQYAVPVTWPIPFDESKPIVPVVAGFARRRLRTDP